MKEIIYIVTPCRNAEKTISETIVSVVGQSGDFYIRYHVQDAQSTDGTVKVLEYWEKMLNEGIFPVACRGVEFTFKSEADGGLYDGINKAVKCMMMQNNHFMTWINADDIIVPGAFSTIIKIGNSHPDVKWVTGKHCYLSEDNTLIYEEKSISYPTYLISEGYAENRFWTFLQQEGTFWKVDLWNVVGGINSKLKLAGDFDLWMKFAQRETLWQLNGPLGIFRKRKGQLSENLQGYWDEIDTIRSYEEREEEWGKAITRTYDGEPSLNVLSSKIQYNMSDKAYVKTTERITIDNAPLHAIHRKFFSGWRALEGISYPESSSDRDYPVIQWGIGSSSSIVAKSTKARTAIITMEVQSFLEDQRITVIVNDKVVDRVRIESINKFHPFEFHIDLSEGENRIDIHYDKYFRANTSDPRELALLYRILRII
jgi:glycosyltransferase involved in cell wall biosynthesis